MDKKNHYADGTPFVVRKQLKPKEPDQLLIKKKKLIIKLKKEIDKLIDTTLNEILNLK